MSEKIIKTVDIFTGYPVQENKNNSDGKVLNTLITEVPKEILDLLSTPEDLIAVTSKKDFMKLIKDYLIHNIQDSNIEFSYEVVKGMDYLSKLLVKMMQVENESYIDNVIANPYYSYWASRGKFQNAGDASVYNYLFRKCKRDIMKPQDHLDFAVRGYHYFFTRNDYENDISKGIGMILPSIQGIASENDFFRRGLQEV